MKKKALKKAFTKLVLNQRTNADSMHLAWELQKNTVQSESVKNLLEQNKVYVSFDMSNVRGLLWSRDRLAQVALVKDDLELRLRAIQREIAFNTWAEIAY